MKPYYVNPDLGIESAFYFLNPGASANDFVHWQEEQLCNAGDPRLAMYGPANLCETALEKSEASDEQSLPSERLASISYALGHYEAMIRLFTAAFDWDRGQDRKKA